MNCPICGNEMEKGELCARGGVFFLPEGEEQPGLLIKSELELHRAIRLPPYLRAEPENTSEHGYAFAFACRNCRKIMIGY